MNSCETDLTTIWLPMFLRLNGLLVYYIFDSRTWWWLFEKKSKHVENILMFKTRYCLKNAYDWQCICLSVCWVVTSGCLIIKKKLCVPIYTGWFRRKGKYFGICDYRALWGKEVHMNMCLIVNGSKEREISYCWYYFSFNLMFKSQIFYA